MIVKSGTELRRKRSTDFAIISREIVEFIRAFRETKSVRFNPRPETNGLIPVRVSKSDYSPGLVPFESHRRFWVFPAENPAVVLQSWNFPKRAAASEIISMSHIAQTITHTHRK